MQRLLMVRHGETELNSALRYWGKSDVKLSSLGLSQAERLRDRLMLNPVAHEFARRLVLPARDPATDAAPSSP